MKKLIAMAGLSLICAGCASNKQIGYVKESMEQRVYDGYMIERRTYEAKKPTMPMPQDPRS